MLSEHKYLRSPASFFARIDRLRLMQGFFADSAPVSRQRFSALRERHQQ